MTDTSLLADLGVARRRLGDLGASGDRDDPAAPAGGGQARGAGAPAGCSPTRRCSRRRRRRWRRTVRGGWPVWRARPDLLDRCRPRRAGVGLPGRARFGPRPGAGADGPAQHRRRWWWPTRCGRCRAGCSAYADPARRAGGSADPDRATPCRRWPNWTRRGRTVHPCCGYRPASTTTRSGGRVRWRSCRWTATVREAVLWPSNWPSVARRASVLGGSGLLYEFTDTDPDDVAGTAGGGLARRSGRRGGARAPGPSVRRAARSVAARCPDLAYLTGDRPPPVGRAFRVLESAPFSEKTVADPGCGARCRCARDQGARGAARPGRAAAAAAEGDARRGAVDVGGGPGRAAGGRRS